MRKLVVYTSFSFLLDTFELSLREKYHDEHFHVIVHRDHPEELLRMVKKNVTPQPDIVIGPHWLILDMQLNSMLRPVKSSEFNSYPREFYDAEGGWCAMALSPVGVAYNKKLVENIPDTLSEVLSAQSRIAVHSITENSEGRMGLAYLVSIARLAGEEKFLETIDKLSKKKPYAFECMPEMALAIGKGIYPVGFPATLACISYYLDIQYRPVGLMMPKDLPYMVTFSPSIGLMKNGENQETAEMAFEFAISRDWQEKIGAFGGKIPARSDVESPMELPNNFTVFPNLEDVANHQKYRERLRQILS